MTDDDDTETIEQALARLTAINAERADVRRREVELCAARDAILKRLRYEEGWTYSQLSDATGISRQRVYSAVNRDIIAMYGSDVGLNADESADDAVEPTT